MIEKNFSGPDNPKLNLVQDYQGHIMKGGDITENVMRLSSSEIKICFKHMMWDIYQKLAPEIQRSLGDSLRKYENQNDIEMGLLTAIIIFNIVGQIQAGAKFDIPKDIEDTYDFPKSSPDYEMLMFGSLFEQVDYYRNNGKLQPPEMQTIGEIHKARTQGRVAVRVLLDSLS